MIITFIMVFILFKEEILVLFYSITENIIQDS